jgi:hypothetical protein
LTWVPVANGKVSASWTANTVNKVGGYAVYKTADWQDAIGVGGYLNGVDWSSTLKRLYDADAPEPVLFLPAAGYRSSADALLYHAGANGTYWFSSFYPTIQSHFTSFTNTGMLDSHHDRAMGHSIRCVKE